MESSEKEDRLGSPQTVADQRSWPFTGPQLSAKRNPSDISPREGGMVTQAGVKVPAVPALRDGVLFGVQIWV